MTQASTVAVRPFVARIISNLSSKNHRNLWRIAAVPALMLLVSTLLYAVPPVRFDHVITNLPLGGNTLNTPVGMAVDVQGNVYIADTSNDRILKVDPTGNATVLSFTGLGTPLHAPIGIAIDPSGTMYLSDEGNSRVLQIVNGAATVIPMGSVTLTDPRGLALDNSGNIYVADTFNGHIVKVSGGVAAIFNISGVGSLVAPTDVAIDTSGNIYIADASNNRIVKSTPSGTGSVLSITGLSTGLNTPQGVAVDSSGTVYIADGGNSRIVAVAPGGSATILADSTVVNNPLDVVVDTLGAVYTVDASTNLAMKIMASAVGLNEVAVGSTSATVTLPFTVSGVTLGNIQALTLGSSSQDFAIGSGSTCASGTTNTSCTIDITFTPTAPGVRRGAVVLYDNSNNLLLSVPLYGTGDAPLAGFSPGTASRISTGSTPTVFPFQIAVDGVGNIYSANYNGLNVTVTPPGGGSTTIVNTGGLTVVSVTGVAVDGAGNLFISDHTNNRIVTVTPSGVASVLTISNLSPALFLPTELNIDAAGNLYIADWGRGRIVKVSSLIVGANSSGVGSVVTLNGFTIGTFSGIGVAADQFGNIYIADRDNNRVLEVTAAGATSVVNPIGITPALNDPQGVAVDSIGNLYIADSLNNRIVEVTVSGVASVVNLAGLTSPTSLNYPFGVAVDASGNLYIADSSNNRIVKADVSSTSLAFSNTNVGASSTAQTVSVTNLGNQPLAFSAAPAYTADFSENTSDSNPCTSSTSLTPGVGCDVSVIFSPQSAGSLSASITLTNNSLNATNATQNVNVSGTGIAVGDTTSVAVNVTPSPADIGQPINITATLTDTTSGHSSTIPTGTVTFTDTVGSTVVSLNSGAAVTLSGGVATLTGVTLTGAGSHTITANYVGVANTFQVSSNTASLTVNKDAASITGPNTQPVEVAVGQTGAIPITVTGPYSVVPVPTGSLSYDVINSNSVSVASGSVTLTAGSTNSTTTVPTLNTLAAGTYTLSLTYGGDANYANSSTATTVQVVVGKLLPTVNWPQPSGITYGTSLSAILNAAAVNASTPVPGTFSYTATLTGGSPSAVSGATVLGAGSYTLTATFSPTDINTFTSATGNVSLSVGKAATTVTLTSSASPVLASNSVTFTATVASSAGTPTGSVDFYEGTMLLGSGTVAQGVATFSTTALAVGAHSVTAVYSGDSNFSASTSSAFTEAVDDFSFVTTTTNSTSATVLPGGTATFNLVISPGTGLTFPSVVNLSVTGLPTGATATFTPANLPAGSGSTNVTLTIQVPVQFASLQRHELNVLALQLSPVMFGVFLLPVGGRIRRVIGKHGRKLLFFTLLLAGMSLIAMTGCGSSTHTTTTRQPQTYPLTVTATSGSLSHSTSLTLTVD